MMNIQGIQPITAFANVSSSALSLPVVQTVSDSSAFANLMLNKLQQTSESIETSNNLFDKYLRGESVPVHDVMIAMGKAKSELQLVLEIRNKILDAYQEITRIQI